MRVASYQVTEYWERLRRFTTWLDCGPEPTEGEVKIRIEGNYLADALRACGSSRGFTTSGGMVDLKLTNAYAPMLFAADGYQLITVPMMTNETGKQAKKDREAKAEATPQAVVEAEAIAEAKAETTQPQGEGEAEPVTDKPKRKRKALVLKPRAEAKEPVAAA